MCSLLRKSVFVCLIVSLLISGAISTSHSSSKIKLEKEVGIVVPVAGVTDMPNEVTLRMYNSNTAATPLTSQTFLRGEYSAYYNIIKSDGLTEMNIVKFEIKFTNFDKFLDYLDTLKRTEDFWIEVDFDGKLIGQREQLDRQITNQILATVNTLNAEISDPSSTQSAGQTGSSSASGTNYQSGASLVKDTSQVSSQKGSTASTFIGPTAIGSPGQVQYNNGGTQDGASQFYYVNNLVGIGTANPLSKLIVGTANPVGGNANFASVVAGGGTSAIFSDNTYSELYIKHRSGGWIFFDSDNGNAMQWGNNGAAKMVLLGSGNVGIGTTSPGAKLEVAGNPVFGGSAEKIRLGSYSLGFNRNIETGAIYNSAGYAYQFQHTASTTQGSDYLALQVYNTVGTAITGAAFVVNGYGNVGIGTTSPCSDCKLAVNGKIRAKEIVVDTGWSDFVFYDNYALMPLQEVEKFIKDNQHLPGIPTAADVEKDGISLGNISAKLLQKIEELTLYVIDLKKENNVLKGDLAVLQKQLVKK